MRPALVGEKRRLLDVSTSTGFARFAHANDETPSDFLRRADGDFSREPHGACGCVDILGANPAHRAVGPDLGCRRSVTRNMRRAHPTVGWALRRIVTQFSPTSTTMEESDSSYLALKGYASFFLTRSIDSDRAARTVAIQQ